jgi:hypothetical protein
MDATHKYSEAYTTVIFTHVLVNLLSIGERLHTHPTYMGLTSDASHMIATFAFLYGGSAAWTVLDVVKLGPFLEKFFPADLTIRAFLTIVVFDVTTRADASQARWALQYGILGSSSVYLCTVRGRAIMELVRPGVYICKE